MQRKFYLHFILSMMGIVVLSIVHAQPAGFLFKKALGGNNHDNVLVTKQTLDGGFVLGGVTNSKDGDVKNFKGGSSDVWVVKLNSAGTLQWQKCLGGGNTDAGTIIHELTTIKNGQLQNDGYIIGATTSSSNGDVKGYKGGSSDMWVVRISSTGAVVWQRTIGGSGTDELISLKPSPDGGFIVSGKTGSGNGDATGFHGGTDILVVKLSSAGTPVWRKTLGSSGNESPQDVQLLNDGSSVILSRINNVTPGGDIIQYYDDVDYWVCRLSSTGDLVWQRTLGGTGNENAWAMLRKSHDGHMVVAGSTKSNDGDFSGMKQDNNLSFCVFKLEISSGSVMWNWAENSGSGSMYGMNICSDGSFLLVGAGSDNDPATYNGGKVVKLSSSGNLLWSKTYGYATGTGEFYATEEAANGDIITIGSTMFKETPGMHSLDDTTHKPDLWVLRISSSGDKIWDHAYGGKNEDWNGCNLPSLASIHGPLSLNNYGDDILDANGNLYTAINTNSSDGDVTGLHAKFGRRFDIWFVRLNTGSTGIQAKEMVSPITMVSAYPNPFKNSTIISFQPPADAPVVLRIYNGQGSLLQERLMDNILGGRMNAIRVELNNYSQGLYYYTVVQGNFIGTGKLLLQR